MLKVCLWTYSGCNVKGERMGKVCMKLVHIRVGQELVGIVSIRLWSACVDQVILSASSLCLEASRIEGIEFVD